MQFDVMNLRDNYNLIDLLCICATLPCSVSHLISGGGIHARTKLKKT